MLHFFHLLNHPDGFLIHRRAIRRGLLRAIVDTCIQSNDKQTGPTTSAETQSCMGVLPSLIHAFPASTVHYSILSATVPALKQDKQWNLVLAEWGACSNGSPKMLFATQWNLLASRMRDRARPLHEYRQLQYVLRRQSVCANENVSRVHPTYCSAKLALLHILHVSSASKPCSK